MKTLYANGCSMTYGAEIGGEIRDKDGELIGDVDSKYRENHAWPTILSKFLNMKIINDSDGGSSNNRIFRTTMDWTCNYLKEGKKAQDLFVAISWSLSSRSEYRTNGQWVKFLSSVTPVYEPDLSIYNFHIEYFLDEDYDSMRTLQYILLLQSWLKTNRIPYLFCNGLLNAYNEKNKSIKNMLFHIDRKRYFKVDDYQDCMHYECEKFGRGPGGHPLEEGHRHWASLLYNYILTEDLQKYDSLV